MASELLSRVLSFASVGLRFGDKRDYYAVFGYKPVLKFNDFFQTYRRQDIASRIIDAPAQAIWRNPPEIKTEGPFKTAWDVLVKKAKLWNAFERVDRLAGLGSFSTLLIGFDKSDLETPASNASEILYLQPYSEESVDITALVEDASDPRFTLPKTYKVKLVDPKRSLGTTSGSHTVGTRTIERLVDQSRILHVAESTLDDNLFGVPRLCKVFNLLDDLLKVAGGSAETFWLEGRKGLHVNVDKEMELSGVDETALADEIEEYQHQLRRVIRTRGVEVNALGSDTPNPKGNFDMIMSLISGTTGIPRRILMGSEAGQLASEQDRANWAERIQERRLSFAEPVVLFPFVKLCQDASVLPKDDDVEFEWPSAFIMSPLEEGQTMAQKARATQNLSKQGESGAPILTQEESRELLGYPAAGGPEALEPEEDDDENNRLGEPAPTGRNRPGARPNEEDIEDIRSNVEELIRRTP